MDDVCLANLVGSEGIVLGQAFCWVGHSPGNLGTNQISEYGAPQDFLQLSTTLPLGPLPAIACSVIYKVFSLNIVCTKIWQLLLHVHHSCIFASQVLSLSCEHWPSLYFCNQISSEPAAHVLAVSSVYHGRHKVDNVDHLASSELQVNTCCSLWVQVWVGGWVNRDSSRLLDPSHPKPEAALVVSRFTTENLENEKPARSVEDAQRSWLHEIGAAH